jgi:protein O-mannosyl-transferase
MSRKKTTPRGRPAPHIRSRWISVIVLSAIALGAYGLYSFHAPLVFDDLQTIQRNTSVRFGEFYWNLLSARSVLYLTFTLNYILSGQEVWSYHVVNFLLHLVNGLFIFLLGERIFGLVGLDALRSRQYATLAAAFFLVHPVQTESVTYISSRSELLSTFFYLIGLLIYAFWPKEKIGFLCSLAVAVPYFFGLGSKETVITLAATIFLYDLLFLSKADFRVLLTRWRFYAIYILGCTAAIYYLLTIALRGTVGSSVSVNLSSWHYFLTELRVIVRYVQLVFLPVGLNLDHYFRPSNGALEPAVIASFAFLVGLAWLGWWLRRRAPVFSFSIFWFFITLAPTSSVVSIIDVIFDHRLYLPLVGVSLSFPFFVDFVREKLGQRFSISGTTWRYATVVLLVLVVWTNERNYVWSNEVRLFTDVVEKSPEKERPYNALAWAYYKQGEFNNAIKVLNDGLQRLPEKMSAFSDMLGNLYLKTGQYDRAVELFKKTTESFTGDQLTNAWNNLGVSYLYMWNDLRARQAQIPETEFAERREQILKPAVDAFSKVLELDPGMGLALDEYINVMSYRGKGAEMEATAIEGLKHGENFKDTYTLAKVAFNRDDWARADEYFEKAEKLGNDSKFMYFNHGYALVQLKQDDRAIEKYVQAIRLDPIFIEAHHNLGLIYMRKNEFNKAADAFAEVLRQDPKHVSSNLNLARIYMTKGDKAVARSYLRTVLEVSPGDQQAAQLWQQIGS